MTNSRKLPVELPMQARLQTISEGAIDTAARTVTLVFTSGATVRRRRYEGWDTVVPFDETLIVSRAAVNLDRLNAGGPVLESHSTWTTHSQLAVVERAWIEGKEGKATVRFPTAGIDDRADRMFGMVADKIIKNVSVGYSIDKLRIVEPEKKGQVEQHIVEGWTPFEISFVTVGADPNAGVRSMQPGVIFPLAIEGRSNMVAANARARMALSENLYRLG